MLLSKLVLFPLYFCFVFFLFFFILIRKYNTIQYNTISELVIGGTNLMSRPRHSFFGGSYPSAWNTVSLFYAPKPTGRKTEVLILAPHDLFLKSIQFDLVPWFREQICNVIFRFYILQEYRPLFNFIPYKLIFYINMFWSLVDYVFCFQNDAGLIIPVNSYRIINNPLFCNTFK